MNEEKRKFFGSIIIAGLLVLVIWLVKLSEVVFEIDLVQYGLQPLTVRGLAGIITAPLLHADFSHLAANTLPLFFLTALLFYFYDRLGWTILILIWLLTGSWVWLFARGEAVHVGASGVIYGLAAFLFLSGILKKDSRLMSVALLISFLYGGLIWGIFPQLYPNKPISWESHLMGLLSGSILAFYFRNSGPQRKVYEWENEDEEEGEGGDESYESYESEDSNESDERDSVNPSV